MNYVQQAARELNGNRRRACRTRLARLTAIPVGTIRDYQRPPTDPQRREMAAPRQRLLALLLVLHRRGEDLDALITQAQAIEATW